MYQVDLEWSRFCWPSALDLILYLPLVASRRDTSGGQAIAFTPTAMCQPLAIFHHTTLSLLWVEGDLLNGEVLVLLLCLNLQRNKLEINNNSEQQTWSGEESGWFHTWTLSSWARSLIWIECLAWATGDSHMQSDSRENNRTTTWKTKH